MINSYIQLIQTIEEFAKQHLQIQRFKAEFTEQMPNFATESEAFPILFMRPESSIFFSNQDSYRVTFYCWDIIQKDRSNINTIVSDTNRILNDLKKYLEDTEELPFFIDDVEAEATPLNNGLMDYAAGWQMTLTIHTSTYSPCEIPFAEQPVFSIDGCTSTFPTYLTCETVTGCTQLQQYIESRLTGSTGFDVFVTGGTYSNGSAVFTNNTGGTFTVNGFVATDTFVTGGTYNQVTGVATFENNLGDTFQISGFTTPSQVQTNGVLYYFNGLPKTFSRIFSTDPEFVQTVTLVGNADVPIRTFDTPVGDPNTVLIPAGIWSFYLHLNKGNVNDNIQVYANVYLTTTASTSTLLFTTDPVSVTSLVTQIYDSDVFYSGTSIDTSDRLMVELRAVNLSNSSGSVTFKTNGTQHYSYAVTPLQAPFIDRDTFVTGGTYSNGSILFTNNSGGTFTVGGLFTGSTDVFVTGGTYNSGTSSILFTNNTGGTFTVSGITSGGGSTDVFVTGATYNPGNDNVIFTNNTGGTFTLTGLEDLRFTGGNVTGDTRFFGQVILANASANTFSATTYLGLPIDIRITGGTFNSGTATFTNNTGGTFNVTGITAAASTSLFTQPIITTQTKYNNLSPIGFSAATSALNQITLTYTATSASVISGLVGGQDGRKVTFMNNSSRSIVIFETEGTGSTTTNRFFNPEGTMMFVKPNGSISFTYSSSIQRWVVDSLINYQTMFSTFDDMYVGGAAGGAASTTSQALNGFYYTNVSNSSINNDSRDTNAGIARLDIGNALNNRAVISGNRLSSGVELGIYDYLYMTRLAINRQNTALINDGTNLYRITAGIGNLGAADRGVYWEFNNQLSGDTVFRAINNNGGALTTVTGFTYTSANAYVNLGIYSNSLDLLSHFFYSLDGRNYFIAAVNTTNFPSGGNALATAGIAFNRQALGNVTMSLFIDYIGLNPQSSPTNYR